MSTTSTNETITSREQFFEPADLMTDPINCGDDREADIDKYVHVFGGALFIAYTFEVLQETLQPGSTDNLTDQVTLVVTKLHEFGVTGLGVHSDTTAEGGDSFRADQSDGAIGCGYAGKRADISHLISDNADDIIAQAEQLMPDLFANDTALEYARQVAAAHGRLAERADSAIGNGRAAVQTARKAGANMMLVDGSHTADEGIINTQPDSTLQTAAALAAGLPAYDHDLWASNELMELMQDRLPHAASRAAIASLIDIIGTMKALGVQTIAVR